jgi:hypothetical protein
VSDSLIADLSAGFASFLYIVAAMLLFGAAVYVSPLIFGSNNEKKMIRSPQEIDAGFGERASIV